MKKLVISLLRRPDRKAEWQKNKLQDFEYIKAVDGTQETFRNIRGRAGWLEPYKKRPLQQNEVACFLSHINAWRRCAELNQPCIIMEDDAIINDKWNEPYYEEAIKKYLFIYLQRNENNIEKVLPIDDKLETVVYPYNMTAYVIDPTFADFLIKQVNPIDFIPVDEFMPEIIKHSKDLGVHGKIVGLRQDSCDQLPREMSDIENGVPFRHYEVHATTCGTDRKLCDKLFTSARHHGIDIVNIGNNIEWKGTDMSALGGGMKINLMKDYLETLNDEDIVLFTDAYDVFYADDLPTIVERFHDMNSKTVFSAERVCWPLSEYADKFPEVSTPYRYLNSGTYIGYVRELKKIMNMRPVKDDEDDQLYVHDIFLRQEAEILLDIEGYIFQTNEPEVVKLGNQLNNPITQCCPCIYHGNGGKVEKQTFDDLYDSFYPSKVAMYIPNNHGYEILADDMLLVDMMTQEQCERMIEIADAHGGWDSLDYDKFPAKEIRLSQIDKDTANNLHDELTLHWNQHIVPIIEQYWKPTQMYGIRDAFVMRYSMDTQVNLALHNDASLVTGSVKLNDDYLGANLIYPRQNISNKDIPVGKMILFPGALTHGHECLPLRAGVKYSYTIWTQRYIGDTI